MISRSIVKYIHASLFLLLALNGCEAPSEKELPNILFIMMDDLGYGQFGINNDTLTTSSFDPFFVNLVQERQDYQPEEALTFSRQAIPTMNRLAREGVIFNHAYTSSNLCSPSRLSIATGRMPGKLGVYRNTDSEYRGLDPGSHLVEILQEYGYATAHIGKWHIGRRRYHMLTDATRRHGIDDTLTYAQIRRMHPAIYRELLEEGYYGSVIDEHNPLENGFNYYYGYNNWASQFYHSTLVWENYNHAGKQTGYNTDVFTDKALDFMEMQIRDNNPFYVQLHYHAVHDSLEPKAPDKYFTRFTSDSYDLNNFYAHVYGVDYNVSRIVNYLKSVDQLENTIIVFTSDNGAQAGGPSVLPGNAPFSGHKGSYFQGGFRVPLFFYWPDGIPQAQTLNHLVSAMDILPTLIEVIEAPVPQDLDGRSLLPLIQGTSNQAVHDHLIWAGLHARAWGFLLETSFKTHGTEREFAPPAWVVVKDTYLLRFTGTVEPNVYKEQPDGGSPAISLFNCKEDPGETSDLSSIRHDVVEELSKIYFDESNNFLPPVKWDRNKWEEIMKPHKN